MFRDKARSKRIKLARSLERVAVPERPYIGRGPRYLVHPTITAACAPSLLAIAAALRDDPAAFDDDELRAVQAFVRSDSSPLYGRDATEAMREAVRLQHTVLTAKAALMGGTRVEDATPKTVAVKKLAATSSLILALAAAAVVPTAFGEGRVAGANTVELVQRQPKVAEKGIRVSPRIVDLLIAKNGTTDALRSFGGSTAALVGNSEARVAPRIASLLLAKNGTTDALRSFGASVSGSLTTYKDANERVVVPAEQDVGRYVDANQRSTVPSSTNVDPATSSKTDIEWPQVGIGLGIGAALAVGLMLMFRPSRQRPLAH